jgi:UDP-N-acetylglucosamine transferase subunit ALG13
MHRAAPDRAAGPAPGGERLRLCVVSSVGGHLREVLELAPAWAGAEVFFIVNDRTEVPLPGPVHRIAHAERDLRVLWNLVEAARLFGDSAGGSGRPDVILSAGAGPAVPVAVVGRLGGAAVVFVETFSAVQRPSLSGRLLYPLTRHFFYQWPALARFYPRGRYAGSVFSRLPAAQLPPAGAEIVVTVGTSDRPFTRLLRWLDELGDCGELPAPLYVQHGASAAPRRFAGSAFLPAPELEARLGRARLVICHAGAGALGTCIKYGLRPLVVPRLARYGEAVNDHQLELATALAAQGQAVLCRDRAALGAALRAALAQPQGGRVMGGSAGSGELVGELAALLARLAAARGKSLGG